MASSFKTLLPEDISNTRTLLHEAIPVTGTIVSGTYSSSAGGEENIKTYAHGMFQSVYDYPYLSSSANHIFDITMGYATSSYIAQNYSTTASQNTKKVNVYNQMSLILNSLDVSGNIRSFDTNGDIDDDTSDDMLECVFLNFARLLSKDEIKKDSFRFTTFTSSLEMGTANHGTKTIGDYGATTAYKTNSPAGDYGLLLTSSTSAEIHAVGHIYYQAGIAVITSALWDGNFGPAAQADIPVVASGSISKQFATGTIDANANAVRYLMQDLSFNNTTELNSTIYFCRAHNTEFNYSSNPTYLSSSEIRVKGNNPQADPVSYITTVGLYSPDNELIAVAKVSEPLKKSPSNEVTLRVRLDY